MSVPLLHNVYHRLTYLVNMTVITIVVDADDMGPIDVLGINEEVVDVKHCCRQSLGRGQCPLKLRCIPVEVTE
jgi:hypothetical protein